MPDKKENKAKKIITPNNTEEKEKEEQIRLKGKYISAIGRRKTAVARIRLYKKGSGALIVNDNKINNYFTAKEQSVVKQPLKLSGSQRELDVSIVVKGSSKKSQAEAVRHGIVRALVELNSELKPGFKAKGWITRDARVKERKKPGLKKARRAPQWSKR